MSQAHAKDTQSIVWVVTLLLFAYGIYRAISLAWVGDDAFISFRYAQNLIEGHGLVYNVGERVEGYTNFLWTILIAVGMWVGAEPVLFSYVFSISSYVATLIILVALSVRVQNSGWKKKLPIAALCVAVQYDFHVFATSGLETALTTLLITAGYALSLIATNPKRVLMAGLVMTLAALARPDALLICFMTGIFFLFVKKDRWKNTLMYFLPVILIYAPYWIIKANYYGYPFPNTYYAKSADTAWYSQGLWYMWLYVKTYYSLLVLPLIMITAVYLYSARRNKTGTDMKPFDRASLLAILIVIPVVVYIVRTGGDFMMARFFIPITPIMFFLIETVLLGVIRNPLPRLAVAALVVLTVLLRWNQFDPPKAIIHGIADERAHYPPDRLSEVRHEGETFRKYLSDLDVTVAFYGTKAGTVFYSEVPTAIESNAGLTDEYIAHLPLKERGRPGHEKHAPNEYLMGRQTNFAIRGRYPSQTGTDLLRQIWFEDVPSYILVYKKNVMDALKDKGGTRFINFEEYLDAYIRQLDSLPPDHVRADLEFFRDYYFDHNEDSARLSALTAHAAKP